MSALHETASVEPVAPPVKAGPTDTSSLHQPKQGLQIPERFPVLGLQSTLGSDRAVHAGVEDGIHADDLATARVIAGTELFARLGVQWLHERNGR